MWRKKQYECNNCGHIVSKNSKFCPNCNANFTNEKNKKKNITLEKIINFAKLITLFLFSILLLITIINKLTPKKTDNTEKYMSWCRVDYDYKQPSSDKEWMVNCIKRYKKIEKTSKK